MVVIVDDCNCNYGNIKNPFKQSQNINHQTMCQPLVPPVWAVALAGQSPSYSYFGGWFETAAYWVRLRMDAGPSVNIIKHHTRNPYQSLVLNLTITSSSHHNPEPPSNAHYHSVINRHKPSRTVLNHHSPIIIPQCTHPRLLTVTKPSRTIMHHRDGNPYQSWGVKLSQHIFARASHGFFSQHIPAQSSNHYTS